ncbi:alpha/beta hydrolase [Anaerobacillus alkaliphilus]|uniref:Alpha/beta hydrolase n=1 Tax=Anaerobacillus alkaliphilus TaxID=1548597 RepID=A0A4Q0VN70_9BACI|nr:alpha/beta hydrolase [Anaerobacillus alkaliphilus]RXI97832.1 alpha/beta hydrolase [Anaerobacillus alkaliphilus]
MNENIKVFNNPNEYLSFYGINTGLSFYYQKERLEEKTCIHIFEPASSTEKTVLLIHGYFDHTGSFKHVINHFLACGYRVIGYDLEGHGLSAGKRGEIQSFNDYVQAFRGVLSFCKQKDYYPNIVIAHSTGAAICTQYLLQYRDNFEKVIYLAPLVRAANWYYVVASSKVVPKFKQELTRKFAENSGDQSYLEFAKKDPLQCRNISVPWVLAMIEWNKKVEELPPSTQDIYIIQGTNDKTVDWKYNCETLRRKFPFAQIALVTDGRHQIMNEEPIIKNLIIHLIEKYRLQ